MEICGLRGYGNNVKGKVIRCSNTLHNHHILNKSKYMKSKAVKKYIKKYPEVFIAQVCSVHNVDRWADTRTAMRILLGKKNELLGSDYVQPIWDGQPWKVFPPEFKWKRIMAAPLP